MKTYIFDYNGTILDDAAISLECENTMLEKRNLPGGYSLEQYRDIYSMPMEPYYRKLGYTFETESFSDVADEFTDLYTQKFERTGLCEGVRELLNKIREEGSYCVILSSCHDGILHEQCNRLGISSFFREIMGTDDYLGGSKFDIAENWMKRNAIHPEDCIYFGDTIADQETADHIGVKNVILVASGHQSFDRLYKVNHNTIHSLKELL